MSSSEHTPFRRLRFGGLCLMWALAAAFSPSARAEDDKPSIDASHPLYKPLELAYKSREALKDIKDYEAVFIKKEANDRDRRLKETTMKIKFREEPFSVYLLFQNPNAGREVIYVQGKNKNQLMGRETTGISSIAGWVAFDPKSSKAMENNKYPITMIGMKNMLDRIITQWEKEGKFGECTVQYYPNAKLGDIECPMIESVHPQQRDEFKFHKTRLYIEKKSQLPIRVEQFAFPGKRDKEGPLVEEYTYSQIKTNLGLKDKDFDHTNPNYATPK